MSNSSRLVRADIRMNQGIFYQSENIKIFGFPDCDSLMCLTIPQLERPTRTKVFYVPEKYFLQFKTDLEKNRREGQVEDTVSGSAFQFFRTEDTVLFLSGIRTSSTGHFVYYELPYSEIEDALNYYFSYTEQSS